MESDSLYENDNVLCFSCKLRYFSSFKVSNVLLCYMLLFPGVRSAYKLHGFVFDSEQKTDMQ